MLLVPVAVNIVTGHSVWPGMANLVLPLENSSKNCVQEKTSEDPE